MAWFHTSIQAYKQLIGINWNFEALDMKQQLFVFEKARKALDRNIVIIKNFFIPSFYDILISFSFLFYFYSFKYSLIQIGSIGLYFIITKKFIKLRFPHLK